MDDGRRRVREQQESSSESTGRLKEISTKPGGSYYHVKEAEKSVHLVAMDQIANTMLSGLASERRAVEE